MLELAQLLHQLSDNIVKMKRILFLQSTFMGCTESHILAVILVELTKY